MRYQFYREHKFVSSALNDLERLIAQTDFCDVVAVARVQEKFLSLADMLRAHAHFEEERIHRLLTVKGSVVHGDAEKDHAVQEEELSSLAKMIDDLFLDHKEDTKIANGYALYLAYRKFVAHNLLHLHDEETRLLPELQRLYSDEELRQVSAGAYREMKPEHMVEMVAGLFPHMNTHDRKAFLTNMHLLEPEKFSVAWTRIKSMVSDKERAMFDV